MYGYKPSSTSSTLRRLQIEMTLLLETRSDGLVDINTTKTVDAGVRRNM